MIERTSLALAGQPAPASSGPLGRFQTWLRHLRRCRQTERELLAMTDRQLADIGLSRCDIPRVARTPMAPC